MSKPPAHELSDQSHEHLERGKALLAKLREIAARGGGEHEVAYTQQRHTEINMLMLQLFTFAVEVADRLRALEGEKAPKPRKRKSK